MDVNTNLKKIQDDINEYINLTDRKIYNLREELRQKDNVISNREHASSNTK